MYEMVTGYRVSQTVRAFADLSLADHLAGGPLTAEQVASRENSAPETTLRLMRAGVALGLLTVDAGQRFRTTALGDTLRSGAPGSLRGAAMALTDRSHWLPWSELVASVRRGRSHAGDVLGMPAFDYIKGEASRAQEFTEAMEGLTALWSVDVAAHIDTTGVICAVDVGGANGSLLRLLQQADPALRGIVFDRPDVAAVVAPQIAGERTEVVGGDFFASVPAGDLYLLKTILHDWDDQSCVEILTNCRTAMDAGARIVIVERVVGDGNESGLTALSDLNMLAVLGGAERTLAQFDALLSKSGLRRVAAIKPNSPHSIIEAVTA
jgi:hypothetical protein